MLGAVSAPDCSGSEPSARNSGQTSARSKMEGSGFCSSTIARSTASICSWDFSLNARRCVGGIGRRITPVLNQAVAKGPEIVQRGRRAAADVCHF